MYTKLEHVCKCSQNTSFLSWYFIYCNMYHYYYISVLCLYDYSVQARFGVGVRVWYYCIFVMVQAHFWLYRVIAL